MKPFTFKADCLKAPLRQSDMIHRLQDGIL